MYRRCPRQQLSGSLQPAGSLSRTLRIDRIGEVVEPASLLGYTSEHQWRQILPSDLERSTQRVGQAIGVGKVALVHDEAPLLAALKDRLGGYFG